MQWTKDNAQLGRQMTRLSAIVKLQHGLMDVVAKGCMFQLIHRKNATPMVKFFEIIRGTSISVVSLNKWLIEFGGVKTSANKDKGVLITFPEDYALLTAEDAEKKVQELPTFWDFAPVTDPFKGFDFDKEFKALLARAEAHALGLKEGTLKVKGELKTLTDADKARIDMGNYAAIVRRVTNAGPVLH